MIFSDTIRWKSAPWKSAAFKLTWIQAPPTVDIPGLPPSVVADYWRSCISVNANVAIKHRGTKIYENIVNHLCSTGWDPITCTISSRYISHLWAAFQLLDYLFARMERANGGQQPTIAATPCDTSSTEPLYSMLVDWPDTLREHGEGRARIPPDIPDPVKHFLTCCRAASLRDSAAVNLEHASWLLGWFFKNGVVVPEKSKIPTFLNSVASSRNLVIPDASMPELARVNSTAMSTSLIFALAASFTLLMGGQQLSALTTGTLDRIKLWNSFGRKDSPILWSVEDIIFNGLCEMVFEGKLASPTLKSLREDPNFKAVITLPADSHERDCFALPPLPSRPSSVSPAPFSFPGALSFTRNQVTGYGVDVDNSPLSKPLPNLREPSFDFSGPTFSASPPFKRYYSSLSNSPVLEYPPGLELGPLSTLSSDSPPQSELAQKRKRAGDDGQDNDITGEEDELEDEKLPTKQARHRRRQKREGGEETDGEGAETDNEGIDSVNGDDEPKEFQLAAVQMVLYRALLDGPSTRTHYVDSHSTDENTLFQLVHNSSQGVPLDSTHIFPSNGKSFTEHRQLYPTTLSKCHIAIDCLLPTAFPLNRDSFVKMGISKLQFQGAGKPLWEASVKDFLPVITQPFSTTNLHSPWVSIQTPFRMDAPILLLQDLMLELDTGSIAVSHAAQYGFSPWDMASNLTKWLSVATANTRSRTQFSPWTTVLIVDDGEIVLSVAKPSSCRSLSADLTSKTAMVSQVEWQNILLPQGSVFFLLPNTPYFFHNLLPTLVRGLGFFSIRNIADTISAVYEKALSAPQDVLTSLSLLLRVFSFCFRNCEDLLGEILIRGQDDFILHHLLDLRTWAGMASMISLRNLVILAPALDFRSYRPKQVLPAEIADRALVLGDVAKFEEWALLHYRIKDESNDFHLEGIFQESLFRTAILLISRHQQISQLVPSSNDLKTTTKDLVIEIIIAFHDCEHSEMVQHILEYQHGMEVPEDLDWVPFRYSNFLLEEVTG